MFKQALVLARTRCLALYTVGEHGTAFFYAVCELPEHIVRDRHGGLSAVWFQHRPDHRCAARCRSTKRSIISASES
jgi:hypothetical protein